MATNKLLEAAAEILAGSKSSAPAMPMQKPEGASVVDMGGPTPQDSKPMDNSNKIDVTKGAKSATAPTTKPSAASSDTQNHPAGGKNTMREEEELEESVYGDQLSLRGVTAPGAPMDNRHGHKKSGTGAYFGGNKPRKATLAKANDALKADIKDSLGKHPKPNLPEEYEDQEELVEAWKKKMKEDVDAMFGDDETISEDFRSKAATIFEARVTDRIVQIQEQIEAEYAGMLEEAVESIKSDLTEKVDDYLNYVVDQWMNDNEIAIESGLRSEITEDFIGGLRNLFAENYINVPEEKVDLIDELASKVEELETQLNEEIETNIEYKKALVEAVKSELTREVCEGLTATQVEKIRTLAESVEFSTEEEYTEKLETLRENYFPSGVRKSAITHFNEVMEDDDKKVAIHDPFVAAVSNAISKTRI